MRWLLIMIVLGGAFGEASVEGAPISDGELEIRFSVEVEGDVTSLVAHIIDPGDDQQTVSLGYAEPSLFQGVAEVERADLVVVFEAIHPDGTSDLSEPATLTGLGLDPDLLGISDGEFADPAATTLDDVSLRWAWAAAALGAAALALIALWALGDYPRFRGDQSDEPSPEG